MVETDLAPRIVAAVQWAVESPAHLAATLVGAVILFHVVPFLTNTAILKYPGPLLAKFTDFWLLRTAMKGHRYEAVHKQHQKYGEWSLLHKQLCRFVSFSSDPFLPSLLL